MVVTSSQTSPFQGLLLRSCNKYYVTAFTDRLIGQKYLTNFMARIDNARSYKHFHHMESTSVTPGTPDLRPLGYKGPRADILVLLKQGQAMSVRDLAARLELSLNATRHHLKGLEDEGVVEHVLEHHGVGAPMHSYRLTAQGQALFPRRYLETLLGMLSVLEATEGRAAAVRILETHFDGLAQDDAVLNDEPAVVTPRGVLCVPRRAGPDVADHDAGQEPLRIRPADPVLVER